MKITITKKSLAQLLTQVGALPTQHDSSLHSACVKLSADMEGITLTRVANASACISSAEGEITEEGECYIGFASLKAASASFNDASITIMSNDKRVEVESASGGRAKIGVVTGAETIAPLETGIKEKFGVPVWKAKEDAQVLREMLSMALEASMRDGEENSPFRSVAIIPDQNGAIIVGADKRRVHLFERRWAVKDQTLIPNESVSAILKAVAGESGEMHIAFTESTVMIKNNSIKMSLPLMEGGLPDVKKVTHPSKAMDFEVSCSRPELKAALLSSAGFANAHHRVQLKTEKRILQIVAENDSGDSYQGQVKSKGSMDVLVNAMFLLDALKLSDDDEVTLGLSGETKMIYLIGDESRAVVASMLR